MNTKTYWLLTVIFAFASVISFFQINSYQADLHHLNTAWKVSGVVFGLAAIMCLWQVAKKWGGGSSNMVK